MLFLWRYNSSLPVASLDNQLITIPDCFYKEKIMKIYTSYFYMIRFMKPNMIPLSTAKWDP